MRAGSIPSGQCVRWASCACCAVLIDGTPFKERQMIAALGIGWDGRKTVLGIREGATENTAVVTSILSELAERGLDFSTPRLYILDGGIT
jgi:putative transposase